MPLKAAKGKEAPADERPMLARFSSHLKIGIVGLPNVGKSTLFNTLTKLSIPAMNFPFCTIEPNEARVYVPDERFDWLCQLFKPKSEVAAFLEINDIAGLVRGANEGQGLGNAFLSHIRAVDGIFHVLRAFDDPDVIHVENSVDPVRDLEIISEELRLKDIEFMEKKIEDCEKVLKRTNAKEAKLELECCQKVYDWLKQAKDVRLGDWKTAEIEILNTIQLLSAKPVVYLINMTEKDYQRKKNKWLAKIHSWVQAHGGGALIPFSGVLEQKLADMPADEAAVYCKENDLTSLRAAKTGEDKNLGYGRNPDQIGNNGDMATHGEEKEGRKGARANAADHSARTRGNDLEKLGGNGAMRKGDSRAGSRGRHMHQPMDFLSTADVQMMYETPDERLTNAAVSRNAALILETAEKPRRTARNRIHHHQGSGRGEDRITLMKVVSSGSNTNLRLPDYPGAAKSSSAPIEDLNRIHQRLHQSAEARDSPRSILENGRSGINVNLDVREHLEDRLRQRRSNNLHDVGSRVPSHRTSSMQNSGDRSPRKHHQSAGRNANHQYEREEQGRRSAEREREPLTESRSTHQQSSPSRLNNSRMHHLSSYRSSYEGDEPQTQNTRNGHVIHLERAHELRTRAREAGLSRRGPKPVQTWFAATELQSNLSVEVADCKFHLHKFPLLSRSGRLNRLVFESRDTNKDHIKLPQMPGGAEAFELCVKFCYGIPVELTPQSVATLRCAAEYLEMTDSLEDENLISKTEHYLNFIIFASWKDSIAVLQSCQRLLPWAEETQIVRRCSESVAWKACTDQTGIKWSFTSTSNVPTIMWDGGKQTQLSQHIPHDWWVEDVIQLNFEAFGMVMTAITAKGMAYTLVGSAIAQYATRWIPGVEKKNRKHQQEIRELLASNTLTGKEIVLREGQNQGQSMDPDQNRALVEGVAAMLPVQQDGVSCSFLLRLLRAACVFGVSTACREELERRVGFQLEHASLSDLLIPSSNPSSQTMYDLDVVQRILEQFLLKDPSAVGSPTTTVKSDKQLHGLENGISKPPMTPSMAKSKVAKLMDAYLAEVARDANLPLARFQNLAKSLPEFSRATDDGLYRAVDTYLKAHPTMTEHERKKLCRVVDCQRLSLEACLHAAQNERLPLRVVVQVLFSEQVKLRNAISGNTSKKTRDHDGSTYASARDHSQVGVQSVASRLDDSEADGLSLHESWLAARQDIKYLKQDMERMKAKYADLEHESLTQQVEKKAKPKAHASSGWTSGWRKLSSTLKPPSLFHTSKAEFEYALKDDDVSMAPTHASGDAAHVSHSNFNTPRAPSEQRRRSHSVTSTFTVQRWRNSIS